MREAKTIISHYPLRDTVIIKQVTKHSGFAINGAKDKQSLMSSKDTKLDHFEVVAYGNQSEDVEIGDYIGYQSGAMIDEIKVEENTKDFNNIKSLLKDSFNTKPILNSSGQLISTKDTTKDLASTIFEIHSYFQLSYHSISRIINAERYKLSISTVGTGTGTRSCSTMAS